MSIRRTAFVLLATLAAGCTPGAAGGVNTATSGPAAAVVDVNLTMNASMPTAAGLSGGYAPPTTVVAVGSRVRFMNSDSFSHTVTAIGGHPLTFPTQYPFSSAALTQRGANLSDAWSSGILPPGASSQTLLADKPGTYLYGCFFHYGAPMRGLIVVR